MVAEIKIYHSIEEITENLDKAVSQTKSNLGEDLRKLDQIRTLAEKSQRIRETVMKLAGKKNGSDEDLGEIEVGSLKIVLDANPYHHLTAIESAVRSQQERLMVLQKAQEGLKSLEQLGDTEGLDLTVLEKQGIPERILLKTS